MRGDYAELQIERATVDDGNGGETDGIVIRIWSESDTYTVDRDVLLAMELRIPGHEPPVALPMVTETIEHVLDVWELR